MYEFVGFEEEHVDAAVRLVAEAYERERPCCALLPSWEAREGGRGEASLRARLRKATTGAGVAVIEKGVPRGFMVDSMRFAWKGHQAAGSDELGVVGDSRRSRSG